MEVKKKALPLHSHLKNGCLRRTRVLKKTGQSEVLSCGLRFENFSKKTQKKFASSEKSLTFATPDSERGLRPENDPRLDPRTQAKDKVV